MTVIIPIRPINIKTIIKILPMAVKSGVKPKDKPTVASAEMTSKKTYSIPLFSGKFVFRDKSF